MESWFGFRLRGARARARSGAPWVRNSGYLGIQEILVLTKSSERTYVPLHVAGVKFFILITPRVSAVSLFVETHTNKVQSRFFVFSETTA